MVRRETFDALVLDVLMPGVDGLGVCRVLRGDGDRTPVLMLTAVRRPLIASRVSTPAQTTTCPSLSSCSPACGRCCAGVVRGRATDAADERGVRRLASLAVDPSACRAWWADSELQLTKNEFDLLELLTRNEGIPTTVL